VKSRKTEALVFAFMMLRVARVSAAESPPPGLHWQELREIRAELLVPDGWLFKSTGDRDHPVYSVMPPQGASRFTLSVERKHKPELVIAEAHDIVEAQRKIAKEATPTEEVKMGVMTAYATLLDISPGGTNSIAIRVALTTIGNSRTGTFYMFRFDIPADEWEATWERGRYVMGKFALEDEE
jgi:hypothetical protein